MASKSSKLIDIILRNKKKHDLKIRKNNLTFQDYVNQKRLENDRLSPPKSLCKKFDIEEDGSLGFLIYYLKVKRPSKKVVIYLHGGGYINGPMALQWEAIGEICYEADSDMVMIEYPLVPEHSCETILNQTVKAYNQVISKYKTENHIDDITVLGDSAGGGLALALYPILNEMNKKNAHIILPQQLILLSPWLDVSMSHQDVPKYIETDEMLSMPFLLECGLAYAGNLDVQDPRVSPMFGMYDRLPETHIFIGTRELLYPDCAEFYNSAIQARLPVILHAYEDMQHVWPIIPFLEEGKHARKSIVDIIEKCKSED